MKSSGLGPHHAKLGPGIGASPVAKFDEAGAPAQLAHGAGHSHVGHDHIGHDAGCLHGPPRLGAHAPPPAFRVNGGLAHFVDLQHIEVKLVIDAATRRARVEATVEFDLPFDGQPALDLDQEIDSLSLDGEPADAQCLSRVRDPDGESEVRVVGRNLKAGRHTITVGYDLETEHLKFADGNVDFFQKATDLTPGYSEMFFPSNLQYDQYALDMRIEVRNTQAPARIFTNGELTPAGDGYSISFPPHFNTSSFYLHVTDPARYTIVEDRYRDIPLEVYGTNPDTVRDAVATIKRTFAELENDYGAFDHPSFTALVLDDYRGGMEYNGATITSPKALEHEIFHSWFARGVMPAGGNAGWFDEALARWRDRGYPRADEVKFDAADYPQLAGRTPYARVTQRAAYEHGSTVMSEADHLLADTGGLKPILRELFQTHRRTTIDSDAFLGFILERTPDAVKPTMRRLFEVKLFGPQPVA